jgi:3-hydroxyisobutyrate dehydrogenase
MRIGFIGLGNMGLPMAANLLRAGHDVAGFDLSPDALSGHAAVGGEIVADVASAVKNADIVITMLPAGKHVRGVITGEDGVLAAIGGGKKPLLIDSSTIDVATAREVAAAAFERGIAMLDAPVSGGVGGATAGTLTFMVGGEENAFRAAEPVLKVMGRNIVHAGEAGAGQAAKICNNMMLGISMIGVAEAFVLAERLELDFFKLFQVASTSSGQCWSLTSYCPVPGPVPNSPANRDYAPGFAAALMLKDLTLAQDAAKDVDAATPLGAHAARIYESIANGQGEKDFSIVFRWLAERMRGDVS